MVKRISSRNTFFLKRMFPLLWFGVLAAAVVHALASGSWRDQPLNLVLPLFMAASGWFFIRIYLWDLADVVEDHGDHLVFRWRSLQVRVPLSNVMNVSSLGRGRNQQVTLRLVEPCETGFEISFIPSAPLTLNPYARNALVDELVERVYRARQSA